MKVKLASQVFSHSVAVAMHTYIDFGQISPKATATANFIENMNQLFDILNSSNLENCHAFMGTANQIDFLNTMDTLFLNLKITDENKKNITNRLKFIYGWRITISSTLKIWELLRTRGYRFLLTRNLNQDCLENYFGQIRNASGNARNPTAIQFGRAFKNLFVLKCFEQSEGSNCLQDISEILLTVTPDFIKKTVYLEKKEDNKSILKVETNDYRNLLTVEGNGLVYVSGYLLRKCMIKHSCDICLNFCSTVSTDISTRFCELKAYNNSPGQFGSLIVPPKNFVEYIISLENLFVLNFNSLCIKENIGHNLTTLFSKVPFTHPCSEFNYKYLLSLYTRIRIFYTLKYANRKFKIQPGTKLNPKLKILKNL